MARNGEAKNWLYPSLLGAVVRLYFLGVTMELFNRESIKRALEGQSKRLQQHNYGEQRAKALIPSDLDLPT